MAFLLEHLPAAAAPGDRRPRRPAAAAGAAAGPRRAPRDPRRRPAFHARGGRRLPQRGDGPGPDGRDVAALEARTEGWIAASSSRRCPCRAATTSATSSPASPATTATSSTTWSRRCCSANPKTSGRSCCRPRSSSRLSGPLCDAVTGQDGGQAMLAALERGNLFLVPLDDRRRWYRYHHLFADVLQAHLTDEQPDRVPNTASHGPANGSSNDGQTAEAIRHALAGRDFPRAADMVELALPMLRRERRTPPSGAGSRHSPTSVINVRPVLCVACAGSLMVRRRDRGSRGATAGRRALAEQPSGTVRRSRQRPC